ncbi:Arylesterase/monoxygenase [Taphrina deformans PYCC 5710]|uniref:Arylesterase/monoxygenase n=1 Tax=Taphrina deformans (strain PYCC 5710 / ATCC 11124 / CBS 356.35 / IMI 108563 / JCM 9778 / NBRC 8474) TaxID=1097556 RepID=R4XAX8_TAPDE|nr:Arylesterase/monoxygenase [Taphrina deformans PYCC 5710]|eukprot:CCG82978.1 Arylesterase/monoxygenase [Taphrina deformans PYCC 5710]
MGLWSFITLPFRTTINSILLVTSIFFFFIRLSWQITSLTPLFSYIAYVSFTSFILVAIMDPQISRTVAKAIPVQALSFMFCAAMCTMTEVPHYVILMKVAVILYVKLFGILGYWLGWLFMLVDVLNIAASLYLYAENVRIAEVIAQKSSAPQSDRYSLLSLLSRSLTPFYKVASADDLIIYRSVKYYAAEDMVDPSIASMEYEDTDTCDIYSYGTTSSAAALRPVLLHLHGGAWTRGSKDLPTPLLPIFAERGFLVVSANYRLAPQYPQPAGLQDVQIVLKWIRQNIVAYGGDASFVIVAGDSAGGHLAHLASLLSAGDGDGAGAVVQGSILLYPALEVLDEFGTGPRERQNFVDNVCAGNQAAAEKLSLVGHLTAGRQIPPALAFHGQPDSLIPVQATVKFADKAKEVGAEFKLITLPLTQHLYTIFNSPKSIATSELAAEWALNLYSSRKKGQ